MSRYAASTSVPVTRTKEEIERALTKYGAEQFGYATAPRRAVVLFVLHQRRYRMELHYPPASDYTKIGYEQEVRSLWRSLLLTIKAKLVSVENGIETVEEAFGMHTLLPDGSRAVEWLSPQLEEAYRTGTMPAVLPGLESSRLLPRPQQDWIEGEIHELSS